MHGRGDVREAVEEVVVWGETGESGRDRGRCGYERDQADGCCLSCPPLIGIGALTQDSVVWRSAACGALRAAGRWRGAEGGESSAVRSIIGGGGGCAAAGVACCCCTEGCTGEGVGVCAGVVSSDDAGDEESTL